MIIVVDTMNRTAEYWVALSSYRLKWLWCISEVLCGSTREPNPSPVSSSSFHKCSTVTECPPLLHYIFTPPLPLHPSFLSLISSFHKSLFATSHSLPPLLFSCLHFVTEACSVLIISVEPWFTFLWPLSPSILPAFQQAPHLTNAASPPPSPLLSPHPPISLHQGWLLPLQTCLSMHLFLILELSFQHPVPSVFYNPSLPWQTDRRHYTDTSRGWSSGVVPLKHFAHRLLVKAAADSIVECQED